MLKDFAVVIAGLTVIAALGTLVYSCIRDSRTPMSKQQALIVAHSFETRYAKAHMGCVLEPAQSGQYFVTCEADSK